MTEKLAWVGIDTGEDRSSLSAIDKDDQVIFTADADSDHVSVLNALTALDGYQIKQIATEAGASVHLIRALTAAGLPVVVYEAHQVSRYLRVRINKTDGNDALGLAEIAKMGRPSVSRVHVKSAETQLLRSQLLFRHKLTIQRVACEGMIRSVIRLNGGRLGSSPSASTLSTNVRAELDRLKAERGVDLKQEVMPLLELAIGLRAFLVTLRTKLTRWAKAHPICSRFLDIPGVGPICAVSFYTAIEDPTRFDRSADVGAYLGLTPVVFQSGKTLKHARISKRGNRLTRSHLTLAASNLLIRCTDSELHAWGKAIASRAGPGKARVALARKLAVIMLALWKSGERYRPMRETAAVERAKALSS